MKTVKQLKTEVSNIIAANSFGTKKEKAIERKRVEFLNECILYLEHNPREEFLKKQLSKLINKHQILMQDKDKNIEYGNQLAIAKFNRENNVMKIQNQINNLKFILEI